jgi:hypothetical protein
MEHVMKETWSKDWCQGFCRTCGTSCADYCEDLWELRDLRRRFAEVEADALHWKLVAEKLGQTKGT